MAFAHVHFFYSLLAYVKKKQYLCTLFVGNSEDK